MWGDWLKEAKSEMAFLAITANSQKVAYISSCAGAGKKERDNDIVNIISKVKQRLQSLKKNLKNMSSVLISGAYIATWREQRCWRFSQVEIFILKRS